METVTEVQVPRKGRSIPTQEQIMKRVDSTIGFQEFSKALEPHVHLMCDEGFSPSQIGIFISNFLTPKLEEIAKEQANKYWAEGELIECLTDFVSSNGYTRLKDVLLEQDGHLKDLSSSQGLT